MTTVAYDGTTMACDTLATDNWGMKEFRDIKINRGIDWIVGSAGETGQIYRWLSKVRNTRTAEELINIYGYEDYSKDVNDPALLLVCADGVFRHAGGWFVECHRGYHAIGSGRDYALAAMALGKSAKEAVALAMQFDNGTGGEIVEVKL